MAKTNNQLLGDWGEQLARDYLQPFFPNLKLCKRPNEKYVDSFNPLVQAKMRSYIQYGDLARSIQDWEPTREYLFRALERYPDYLIMLLFHDGKTPRSLVYGALLSAKDSASGGVEWKDTKKKGMPVKKIALVSMHKKPGNWPSVMFFNNQTEFNEKIRSWLSGRDRKSVV